MTLDQKYVNDDLIDEKINLYNLSKGQAPMVKKNIYLFLADK